MTEFDYNRGAGTDPVQANGSAPLDSQAFDCVAIDKERAIPVAFEVTSVSEDDLLSLLHPLNAEIGWDTLTECMMATRYPEYRLPDSIVAGNQSAGVWVRTSCRTAAAGMVSEHEIAIIEAFPSAPNVDLILQRQIVGGEPVVGIRFEFSPHADSQPHDMWVEAEEISRALQTDLTDLLTAVQRQSELYISTDKGVQYLFADASWFEGEAGGSSPAEIEDTYAEINFTALGLGDLERIYAYEEEPLEGFISRLESEEVAPEDLPRVLIFDGMAVCQSEMKTLELLKEEIAEAFRQRYIPDRMESSPRTLQIVDSNPVRLAALFQHFGNSISPESALQLIDALDNESELSIEQLAQTLGGSSLAEISIGTLYSRGQRSCRLSFETSYAGKPVWIHLEKSEDTIANDQILWSVLFAKDQLTDSLSVPQRWEIADSVAALFDIKPGSFPGKRNAWLPLSDRQVVEVLRNDFHSIFSVDLETEL